MMVTDARIPQSARERSEPFGRACERIVDRILGREATEGSSFVRGLADTLGLAHIACHRFETRDGQDAAPAVCLTTWSEDWRTRYRLRRYHEIDPVVLVGRHASSPFDWRSFRVLMPEVASFLEDAAAHGVGLNGLTVPVRGSPSGFALVSLTSDADREDWDAYRRTHWSQLKTLSCLLHVLAGAKAAPGPKPSARRSRMLAMLPCRFGLVAAQARREATVRGLGV